MPKLFDLIGMTDEQNKNSVPLDADFKIPDTIQFVDNQTQENFHAALKEYCESDLNLTARKRLILIDSVAGLEFGDPSDKQPHVEIDSKFDKPVQEPPKYVQETRCIDPMWSGTTSTVINGNTISSGTSFNNNPAMPGVKTIPAVKRKKSDHAVVVSIKDQLKKKARRKLAADSRRKNR